MVAIQYRLVREKLGLTRLLAVAGASMGGMQAFEWSAAHHDFVDRFISIVGSPQAARHDRTFLRTEVRIIEAGLQYGVPPDSIYRMLAGINILLSGVQDRVNRRHPSQTDSLIAVSAVDLSRDVRLEDWAAQSRAILAYDFNGRPGGDSASAAARLKGRFLVIGSPDDRIVSVEPAFALARRIGADTLVIRSSCGHQLFVCEAAEIGKAVQAFLDR